MNSRASLVLAMALQLAGTSTLPAQRRGALRVPDHPDGLTAMSIQDLRFGTVLSGVPVRVLPQQHDRAGEFEIRGPAGASVRVDLVLPSQLVASDVGATLPLSFGPGDGLFASTRAMSPALGFNPLLPVISSLSGEGRMYLRIGGTALPGLPQVGGRYRGTISVTVYDLGS